MAYSNVACYFVHVRKCDFIRKCVCVCVCVCAVFILASWHCIQCNQCFCVIRYIVNKVNYKLKSTRIYYIKYQCIAKGNVALVTAGISIYLECLMM